MNLACASCPVRDSAACSVLSEEERDTLASLGRTRTLKRGEMLFAAGDEDAACATLVSGALKICAASPPPAFAARSPSSSPTVTSTNSRAWDVHASALFPAQWRNRLCVLHVCRRVLYASARSRRSSSKAH